MGRLAGAKWKIGTATGVLVLTAIGAVALLSACHPGGRQSAADDAARSMQLLANVADGTNWAGYGRTFDETRFSPLAQINDGNVAKLGLAWYLDLPASPSVVTVPIAVDGTIYMSVGFSVVSGVDAKSGKTLWSYDPKVTEVAGEKLQPAWGIRGLAYWDGKVYTGTQDGRLIAINAKTGQPVWTVETTQGPNDGRFITGAPRVFDGMVVIGHGGADTANVRGYVTAYDAATGKQRWRFYTVPGNPAVDKDETTSLAAKTWTGEWWKYGGGGTVWNAMTYDPELDRIYLGTGNGAPWNRHVRSPGGGDNLFLCSVVALDAKTGKYLWHYQTTPGEAWDYNSAMDMTLATLTIDGKPRRVILHAPKNGIFYVIDRDTGKLISGKPFVKVNWNKGLDANGRPIDNPEARPTDKPFLVWPSAAGGHSWHPQSFSPATGLVYLPIQDMPNLLDPRGLSQASWRRKDTGLDTGYHPMSAKGRLSAPPGSVSALLAWDPVAQKAAWSVPLPGAFNGGVASTAGNLVFQGNVGGQFVAYDARSGKTLWSFDAHNGVTAAPITYTVGGVQYVSVIAGVGGTSGGTGVLLGDRAWEYREQKRRLLTFVLGGTARLPDDKRGPVAPFVTDPAFRTDPAKVDRGADTFFAHCTVCHGAGAVAGGSAPDLRRSAVPADETTFAQVVSEGMLVSQGMPRFDKLQPAELTELRHYIRFQARAAAGPR